MFVIIFSLSLSRPAIIVKNLVNGYTQNTRTTLPFSS